MRYNLNPTALLALVPLTPEPKANRLKLLPIRFRPDGVGMATDGHVMGFYTEALTPQDEGESLPPKGLTVLALNGWKPILSALKRSKGRVPAVLDTDTKTLTVYSQKHAPAPFVVALDPEGFPEDGTLLQCVPRPDTRATLPALTVNPDLLGRFGTDRLTLTFTGAGRGARCCADTERTRGRHRDSESPGRSGWAPKDTAPQTHHRRWRLLLDGIGSQESALQSRNRTSPIPTRDGGGEGCGPQ